MNHGLINVTVEAISVNLTFGVLRSMILGQNDMIHLSNEEQAWWEELAIKNEKGLFFASFIGFLVCGTK
ncbi:hypothetical protein D3C80_2046000 [compost metagenome]